MLKKLVSLFVAGALMVGGALAQETVTETVGSFTVTFPAGFTLLSNNARSFTLTAEDGTQVNFATPEELEISFQIVAENAEEAFDLMIDALVTTLGATKAEDGITELTINGLPASVQKVGASGGSGESFYFGIMTFADGTWGLIGFTANYETQPELLESIYSSVTISNTSAFAAINEALRPSEMPEGKMVLFSATSNIVFDVPEGLTPFSDDPVFESISYQTANFSPITVLTIDMSFANSLAPFLESYISTLAGVGGHEDFVFADHVVVLEEENGAQSYLYNSTLHVEDNPLVVFVAVKGIRNTFGLIVQGAGPSTDGEAIGEVVRAIFESVEVVQRTGEPTQEATETTDSATASPSEFLSADGTTCSTVAFSIVDANIPEKTVSCPSGCNATNSGTVWGTDIYTNDSAICAAAIHAGILEAGVGGDVKVIVELGQNAYAGTTRNGITTSSYGSWGGSFVVEKP